MLVLFPFTDITEDLYEIYTILCKARKKWFNFGLCLKVEYETLKAIEKEQHNDPSECLRKILIHYLESGGPITHFELCRCLNCPTVEQKDVAEEIDKYFKGRYCSY